MKIKIYELILETEAFQTLELVSMERDESVPLIADGTPHKSDWRKICLTRNNILRPEPDVWYSGIPGAIAVLNHIYMKLGEFMEMGGEVFSGKLDGDEIMISNITECYDCLVPDKCAWNEKDLKKTKPPVKYAFNKHVLPESTLFKIPEAPTTIFVWENSNDPDCEMKAACKKHEAKGIQFKMVWSG